MILSPSRCAAAALAASVALTVSSVHADDKRIRNACGNDFHRLCPREKKDSPALRYCVEAKGRFLSRNCIRALEDAGEVPRGYFDKG
jgi:hypothetical protein